MKKKHLVGLLSVSVIAAVSLFMGGSKAEAAPVLTGTTDLKGQNASIVTENGVNVLKAGKAVYELNDSSTIYSSRTIRLTLNNTTPVNIDSIYSKGSLDVRGNGQLNMDSKGHYGVTVENFFDAFKFSGNGKIVAKGRLAGLHVQNEIRMKAGQVEAYGKDYGIWTYNDIKIHDSAKLKGTASEGTGIWAYRDIYAFSGATVAGEGQVSGARSAIAHIVASGQGSSVTGISHNINSGVSALHADKRFLQTFCGGTVREEYVKPAFEITKDVPVFVTNFDTVRRNMANMRNYTWRSEPANVFLNPAGGLLGDPSKGTPRELKIVGTRSHAVKGEPTDICFSKGTHEVIFSSTPTKFTLPVVVKHFFDEDGSGNFVLKKEIVHDIVVGETVKVSDLVWDWLAEYPKADVEIIRAEPASNTEFVVTEGANLEVNYYYEGQLEP